MPPKSITWSLDDHTYGEHRVLGKYMDAWLPIMTRHNGKVLFIDAFAGPGEYKGGEPGSPVIALKALINHKARGQMKCEIEYVFIEKDPKRHKHLEGVLSRLEHEIPTNCNYRVIPGTFDETLTTVLNRIEEQNRQLDPCFVMIDPFGVAETPMKTIGRIVRNKKSEIYISFMYEAINRFKNRQDFERSLSTICLDAISGNKALPYRKVSEEKLSSTTCTNLDSRRRVPSRCFNLSCIKATDWFMPSSLARET